MANIASGGGHLFKSNVSGREVVVTGNGRTVRSPIHTAAFMENAYFEDSLAVSPTGVIAVAAKTADDKAWAWVEGKSSWTLLGPASGGCSQYVAWVNGAFRFARIDKGGGSLVEQTVDGHELKRTAIPGGTSQGILQFDEISNTFILTDSRLRVSVGSLTLIKAVRRLRGSEVWWAGQATGPDRLVVSNGSTPLNAGVQPRVPQFLVIGQDFYVNGGKKSPYPPDSTPVPPEPPEPPVATIPNHKDVVVRARAKYAAYSGPERAYLICNQVAWDLRTEGAGHFYKDSGSQYNQRSLDIIIFKGDYGAPAGNGPTYDILGDAEGQANPQWGLTKPDGYGKITLWRAAVDPASIVPEPGPGPEPPEPTPPPSGVCKFQSEPCKFTPIDGTVIAQLEAISKRLDELELLLRSARVLNGLRIVGQGRIEPL